MSTFGARLKARRLELGMSQPELAAASGVGQSSISRVERGEGSTSHETALALARAAGLEVAHEPGLPASVPALLVGLVILLRRRTDARRETLAILHELAHYLLARAEPLHTHADVWTLTLLLAAPPAALSALAAAGVPLDADRLAWEATVPRWAAEERLALGNTREFGT